MSPMISDTLWVGLVAGVRRLTNALVNCVYS
jgi:hypothetical protein